MKFLKNLCTIIAVCGFILAYDTAGTSDFAMETNQNELLSITASSENQRINKIDY